MRCCHDKRLRIFRLWYDCSSQYMASLCFLFFFSQNGRLFLFLRNVHSSIEILKNKILEHSDPPSQHFFVHKAFSRPFLRRRKVVLCHLAEWHNSSFWDLQSANFAEKNWSTKNFRSLKKSRMSLTIRRPLFFTS